MNQLVFPLLAVPLVLIGIWARRNAPELVSPHLEPHARAHRGRVIRRGGVACIIVAAGFVTFAVAEMVQGWT